jgi:hypothetical protein
MIDVVYHELIYRLYYYQTRMKTMKVLNNRNQVAKNKTKKNNKNKNKIILFEKKKINEPHHSFL